MRVDPKTGREFGDHGTGEQAVEYALDHGPSWGCEWSVAFLQAWREGNLDEFPEFYAWLKDQPK